MTEVPWIPKLACDRQMITNLTSELSREDSWSSFLQLVLPAMIAMVAAAVGYALMSATPKAAHKYTRWISTFLWCTCAIILIALTKNIAWIFNNLQFGNALWLAVAVCLLAVSLLVLARDSGDNLPRAKDEASFLNDIYLNQALCILKIGLRRELQENDVPEVSAWEKCGQICQPFEAQWKKESGHVQLPASKKPNLLIVLLKTFGLKYFFLQFSLCILDLTYFFNPLIMESLISHVENIETHDQNYTAVSAMFVATTISSILYNRVYFAVHRMTRHIIVTVRMAIFNKALTMTNESRQEKTTGELISLITEDCDKLFDACTSTLYVILMPFKVLLSMFLLYRQIGISAVYGLLITLSVIPVNIWTSKKLILHQKNRDRIKEDRVKVLNEILNGIKVLKLYAWEISFINKISVLRNQEIAVKEVINLYCNLLEISYRTIPFMVQVTSFTMFIFSGGHFTPAAVFVSSTLFGLLYSSFSTLSYIFPHFIQAAVSIKRLNKFLHQEDIPEDIVLKESNTASKIAVKIVDGTFTWQSSAQKMTLTNINVKVPEGSLVAIVGMVGVGKTSLLSAILGQMQKISGNVTVKGRTAYVPQEAWIQNITLKDNILFGSDMRKKKYQDIIKACALTEDLKMLSDADDTVIGERGINLSGGQKQRVSLARSVYSDADVYLLDDPLSAVDSHVGKHIFHHVVGADGLLKNKTRILVTHGVHWLPFVDEVIVMKDGTITEMGSYRELLKTGGDFTKFLSSTLSPVLDCQHNDQIDVPLLPLDIKDNLIERTIDQMGLIDGEKNQDDDNKEKVAMYPTAEEKLTGFKSSKMYVEYLKAIGLKHCLVLLIVFAFWLLFKEGKELWLGKWTDDSLIKNVTLQQTPEYSRSTIYYLCTYIIIGGFGIVISGLFQYLAQSKALDAATGLHHRMLHNIMRAPMSFFDTTPTGRILSRFSKDVASVDDLGDCLDEYFRCSGAVIIQLAVILFLNPRILPFIILVTCIFLYLQHLFSKTAQHLRRYRDKQFPPVIDFFKETLHGVLTIRAFGAQSKFISKMQRIVENHLRFDVWEMIVGIWFDIQISVLSYLVVFASGFVILWTGTVSPAYTGLILLYSAEFVYSLGWFMTHSTHTEQELVSLERVLDFTNKPVEARWDILERKPNPAWPPCGEVKFENYKARYREGLDLVLKDVSCHIYQGEKIGIVGRTGAGKSSLMSALFRLMEAEEGQIYIDDCNISVLGLHDLRKNITILPQDPVIFGGSLRINLDPLEEKTDEELWEALQHSHLKTFVNSLPDKLDYCCGEGGKNLSVGQRQLICLARTLLRKTKILVLDEATASVDIETDALIQRTICTEFSSSTVLTIAHRINTIMDYDRILVLDQGKVQEFDTPKNLLTNKNSMFYSLAKDVRLIT